jgi:hypothetical protein
VKNWAKNTQVGAYNGARTVFTFLETGVGFGF